MSYTVAAVDKALNILEQLAEQGDLGVTELAAKTGSTKSQVFRLLYTLEQRGFVRKDSETRRYALGYRTLYVADKTQGQMSLVKQSQPLLDELASLSGENAHLVIREGERSVCIALSESSQPLRLYAQVGRRGPLHAGGASKVLLAFAPVEVRKAVLASELQRFTAATITNSKALEQLLNEIRRTGLHACQDDLDEGAFSVAAPVRNHTGKVIAALSVAGPTSRLDTPKQAYLLSLVEQVASTLSVKFGWQLEATAT